MARRKIILSTSQSATQLGNNLMDILKGSVLARVRESLQFELDRELSRIFQFISSQMKGSNSNFGVLRAYLPQPWKPYSKAYARQKNNFVGHLRWFSYKGKLGNQLGGVSEQRFLALMGKSKITISRDRSIVTASMAPRLRMKINDMEDQLHALGFISNNSFIKLKGRANSYRPLIGPMFQYFMKVRLPQVVRRTIKGSR